MSAAAPGPSQQCHCGLNLNIWQNPWNHEAGCSMQPTTSGLPTAAEPTDGLREVLRVHHPIMRSETGPFSGCRCGQVQLGQDVIAHVVGHLAAGPLADLLAKLQAVEALADDFDANGNSGPLGDPRANAWHKSARLIRRALAGQHTTDEEADRG